MSVSCVSVDGLLARGDNPLAVMAGGLIFSAGLSVTDLAHPDTVSEALDEYRSVGEVATRLLNAAGPGLAGVAKIKATLADMRGVVPARATLEDAFGRTPLLVVVGGEPCETMSGVQLELVAGDAAPQRIGFGVRLGPLAFAAGARAEEDPQGSGDLSTQAKVALTSILSDFATMSLRVGDIVKVNNTAACWHDYALYNAVYNDLFKGSQSARCSVGGAAEHMLGLIQVEAIAAYDDDKRFVDSTHSGVGRTTFEPDPRTEYRSDIGRCKGPHTHGARAADLVFIAGECPYDANDTLVGPGDIAVQTQRTMENVAIGLTALGTDLADVVKFNVTLSDARLFAAFDRTYRESFGTLTAARSIVAAPLGQYGILVEIEAIAVRGSAENRTLLFGGEK